MLKRNLIANYIGQAWSALMGLAFVPLYIKYLGIEAYGLIGLFATLTAWFSLLDLGMTPTLSREMSRFTAGSLSLEGIRDLLRSIEVITFAITLAIAGALVLSANWVATSWLRSSSLPIHDVRQAVAIMGLVGALRFAEMIYLSSILGLQRQVLFNIVNSTFSALRSLGAVGVLAIVSPTIQAFFLWQAILSPFSLISFAAITYSSLPSIKRGARFSREALQDIWRFAGGMLGITFLALLLTQVDKIILSKLLGLRDFGYYALASSLANVVYIFVAPITQAFYPKLCEYQASRRQSLFNRAYHLAAQLVTVTAGSCSVFIIVFGQPFLRLCFQDDQLAASTSNLLRLPVAGNLINGLMYVPYQAQLAFGWTRLAFNINICAVMLIVPAILVVPPRYGATGAAWVWSILNLGYLLIAARLVFTRILKNQKSNWYFQDVIKPLLACTSLALTLKCFVPKPISLTYQVVYYFLVLFLITVTAFLSARLVRLQLISSLHALTCT